MIYIQIVRHVDLFSYLSCKIKFRKISQFNLEIFQNLVACQVCIRKKNRVNYLIYKELSEIRFDDTLNASDRF